MPPKSKPKPTPKKAAVSPSPSPSPARGSSQQGGEQKSAWALRTIDECPEWMTKPFIYSGYRVGYSIWMALASFFFPHNEIGNVLTHFAGLLCMLWLSFHLYAEVLEDVWAHHHVIFLIFAAANAAMCGFSTLYHLTSCVSPTWYRYTMWLDYTGISSLLIASFVPGLYYAFACHPFSRNLYLGMIASLGSIALIGPCFSFWDQHEYRAVRIGVYCFTGASGVVPAVHSLLTHPPNIVHVGVAMMFIWYAVGVVFYLSKWPESQFPGRFDYFGSHALWHVCVTAAAVTHFITCVALYQRFTTLEQACSS